MKIRNQNDEEKLNIKVNDLIINDSDLSLDDELEDNSLGWWDSSVKFMQDKWADTYKWLVHHPLLTYSVKRVFYGLVTLLIAVIVIFLLVRAVTDDNQYLPPGVAQMHLTQDQIHQLLIERMKSFGVYGSLGSQLGHYLKDLFPLIPKHVPDVWRVNPDGTVYQTPKTVWLYLGIVTNSSIAQPGTSVLSVFDKAIPYTFVYALIAVVISYIISIPLGIEAARHKGKSADSIINGFSIVLTAIPAVVIVLGIYLIATGAIGTSGLYASGSFWSKFWPMIALILIIAPPNIIMIRRYVIDEMSGEYVNFALSQGLSNRFVYYVYVFRNASARVFKAIPVDLVLAMFGTTILVEQQWGIPGLGRDIVNAIGGSKDSFVIMGFVSFAAFIEIFSTLLSDLIIVWLDPRASLNQRQ